MRSTKAIEVIGGERFGRLLIVSEAPRRRDASSGRCRRFMNCICDCGQPAIVDWSALRSRNTVSCGCFDRSATSARFKTHGHSKTKDYRAWQMMIRRCHDPRCSSFKRYGARGISVCSEWHNYEVFLADMGLRAAGMTLERVDNNGNYEPGNVRWATHFEQASNTRRTIRVKVNGETTSLARACALLRLSYRKTLAALHAGSLIEGVTRA